MQMPRVKGTGVIETVKAMKSLGRERARELLPGTLHHYLDERIMASLWYPEEEWAQLLKASGRLLKERTAGLTGDVFELMGRTGARDAYTSVYAGTIEKLSVERILRRMSPLWETYHDTGDCYCLSSEPGHAVVEVRGYGYPFEEFCRMQSGWWAGLIEVGGGSQIVVTEKCCVNFGGESCVWELSWKEPAG